MFIISLTYKKPIEEVEAHLDEHVDWLKKGYAEGICVASGRKIPRTGGIVMARGERSAVEAFCKDDPFIVNGVADFELTEVGFSMTEAGLEGLKD